MSRPADPGAPSLLTTLPPEMRNRVYRALFRKKIGSNFDLVKRIIIDANRVCSDHYFERRPRELNFLPLAKKFWSRKYQDCELIFENIGEALPEDLHSGDWYRHGLSFGNMSQGTLITNLFKNLVIQDALQLRRYARFSRILNTLSILCISNCEYGYLFVVYKSPLVEYRYFRINLLRFGVLCNGSTGEKVKHFNRMNEECNGEMLKEEENSDQAQVLPDRALRKIFELSCIAPDGILADLNVREAYGLDLKFCLMSEMRFRFKSAVFASKITYKISSTEKKTGFGGFGALKDWLELFQLDDGPSETDAQSHDLVLEFDADAETPLEELEINIWSLLWLDWSVPKGSRASFRKVGAGSGVECIVDIPLLLRRAFLLIFDILLARPKDLPKEIFEICINGRGQVLRAQTPHTSGKDVQSFMRS
ncbi:hypothetical protein BU23DRAFT_639656 [Bimuria novae-zelandiae CBS 107.79]|uniref:Uncharacterized protein n=1 Tax=Bimuria novae-zelandiae CBS 107.79 TaxID=1447943 RepID=A0A6A5VAL9_9PLEO|nr:hypothetical protein BU23DRAFT_639656 [Bimuria novae-zelandiae CBS 107.79]